MTPMNDGMMCSADGEVLHYDDEPEYECADKKVPYEQRIITERKAYP